MERPAEPQPLAFDLDQSEMLGLMAAVNTSLILGIDNDVLVPDSQEDQRDLALAGLAKLKAKGWLSESEEEENYLVFEANLGMMAPTVAYPDTLVMVSVDQPGTPQQQYRYYRSNPVHLALDMPGPGQYRLIAIQDAITMLNEIRSNLLVESDPAFDLESFSMPVEPFLAAKDLAEAGQLVEAAEAFMAHGSSESGAAALAQAINRPTMGGNIAFLAIEDQQISDGRNLVMVKDDSAAWMIQPREDNPELLQIQTATPGDYSEVLLANMRAVI